MTDADGIRHSVTVSAASLYEAAAAAIAAFRQEPWSAPALTPNAVLRVEVQPPPIRHDVPVRSVERWANAPAISPSERLAKRSVRER